MKDLTLSSSPPPSQGYLVAHTRLQKSLRQAKGGKAWIATPSSLVGDWIEMLHRGDFPDKRRMLSPYETRAALRSILKAPLPLPLQDKAGALGLNPELHLESIYEGASLLWQHGVPIESLPDVEDDLALEHRLMAHWMRIFQALLDERKLFTPAGQAAYAAGGLSYLVKQGALSLPKHLTLIGFAKPQPWQNCILSALSEAGTELTFEPALSPSNTLDYQLSAEQTPYARALDEAAAYFQSHPKGKLALVVPNLNQRLTELEASLWNHPALSPSLSKISYQIASALALSHLPWVSVWLSVLRLASKGILAFELKRLCYQPHFIPTYQGQPLCKLTLANELFGRFDDSTLLTLSSLSKLPTWQGYAHEASLAISRFDASDQPLLEALQALIEQLGLSSPCFDKLESSLNTAKETPKEGHKGILDALSSASALWEALSNHRLLGMLSFGETSLPEIAWNAELVLTHTPYTLSTSASQLSILRTLEPEETSFDKVLYLVEPTPVHHHPLIPIALQVQYQFPAVRARADAASFAASAHALGALCQDGITLISQQAHSLWQHFEPKELRLVSPSSFKSHSPALLENLPEPVLPKTRITGGAGWLKNFITCPFLAEAEHGLKLKLPSYEPESLAKRLALIRGQVLHQSLQRTIDHKELTLSKEGLIESLKIADDVPWPYTPLEAALLAYEADMLQDCLTLYMNQVHPFLGPLLEVESKAYLELAGQTISLRLDRVDETSKGSLRIIDYKTSASMSLETWKNGSASHVLSWLPDDGVAQAPTNPQLWLYFLTRDKADSVAAIYFSQTDGLPHIYLKVQGGDCPDIPSHEQIHLEYLPLKSSAQSIRETIQTQVEAWAKLYTEGEHRPQYQSSFCDFCKFQALCRREDAKRR